MLLSSLRRCSPTGLSLKIRVGSGKSVAVAFASVRSFGIGRFTHAFTAVQPSVATFIEVKDESGEHRTISSVFAEAAEKWPDAPFLVSPRTANESVLEISYKETYEVAAETEFIRANSSTSI
jgi:hypothetical protein